MKYIWVQNVLAWKCPIVLLQTDYNFKFSDRVYVMNQEGLKDRGQVTNKEKDGSFIGYCLVQCKNTKIQKIEILNQALNSIKHLI